MEKIEKVTIEMECEECLGEGVCLGVYHMFGPPGVAGVCEDCGGSGKLTFTYTPFTGLKQRTDIQKKN